MDATNLEVMMVMRSLKSKGLVKETYSWQYRYYTLNDEGMDYIREFLHLPATIVPSTLKKTALSQVRGPGGRDERRGNRERRGNDRDNFRNDDRKKKSTPLGVDGAKPVYNAGRGGPRS